MSEFKRKNLQLLLPQSDSQTPWKLEAVIDQDCMAYLAYHSETQEAIWVDPKKDSIGLCLEISQSLQGYLWKAVMDTHTHADHISGAAFLAEKLSVPYVMHEKSLCQKVDLRVSRKTVLPTRAGPILILPTPGHTLDGVCIFWGPFLFAGDTVFIDDVGRDDLPGGNPEAHFESLQEVKKLAQSFHILLPGHDNKGGRVDYWENQLKSNSSLFQGREDFVKEAGAFVAPAPKLFKESLVENTR